MKRMKRLTIKDLKAMNPGEREGFSSWRERHGWTLEVTAFAFGVSDRTVATWERDDNAPAPVRRLMDVIDRRPAVFMVFNDETGVDLVVNSMTPRFVGFYGLEESFPPEMRLAPIVIAGDREEGGDTIFIPYRWIDDPSGVSAAELAELSKKLLAVLDGEIQPAPPALQ